MTMKLGINGFGRIGRLVMRAMIETNHRDMTVVCINDPAPLRVKAHLLRYDSVHGTCRAQIETGDKETLLVNGCSIKTLSDRNPLNMPWRELDVDIVLECTGALASRDKASAHLEAGARRVLISAPGKGADITVVYGINEDRIDASHHVVSNASCTTNCLAPIAKILHEAIGIEKGFMTTVHAYTGDQRTLDAWHMDLYRARAAALSLVPTSTGAARALGLILPELDGKIDGASVRVPTPNVSLVDLTVNSTRRTDVEEVNRLLRDAANTPRLKGILRFTNEPLVSSDFNHDPASSIVAADHTRVIRGDLVRVLSWYDNEWGFANRMLDTARKMGEFL